MGGRGRVQGILRFDWTRKAFQVLNPFVGPKWPGWSVLKWMQEPLDVAGKGQTIYI